MAGDAAETAIRSVEPMATAVYLEPDIFRTGPAATGMSADAASPVG